MTYDVTKTVFVLFLCQYWHVTNMILSAGRHLLLKVWFLDQQHQHYVTASWKCRILGAIPEIPNHDL